MRKNAILASVAILVVAVGAYLVWQGNSVNSNGTTPPTPSPTPLAVPIPTPAPTSQDYKAPFKTFSGKGIYIEYPSSWTLTMPLADDPNGIASILSPSTKEALDNGTADLGYAFNVKLEFRDHLNPQEYVKGESITVGGKKGYRVNIAGQGINPGAVVELNKGFYVIGFPPGMDREFQDTILQHISFTN
jgi:hypothetical protein